MNHEEIKEEINYSDTHSAIVAALQLVNEGKAAVYQVADALFEYLQEN